MGLEDLGAKADELLANLKEKFDRDEVVKGPNPSGLRPVEYNVLVEPMPVDDKIGNILLPDQHKDREKFAQMKGRVIAQSPLAHSYAEPEEWVKYGAEKPKPGDVVLYAKYAGVVVKGVKDGKEYQMIKDKDILSTIEE
jgi:co-chaperonin GroES (HSP10)